MLGDGSTAVHRRAPILIVGKMVHLSLSATSQSRSSPTTTRPSFGSGAVKITGAHDFNDYAVAKR
jgi:valyl-tRNA synthetase